VSAVSASTGTATTAIADKRDSAAVRGGSDSPRSGSHSGPYVGRFAPSPTGSLHLGSLVAAVGSFVDARHHGGRWLVRMEDLDSARVVPGSDSEILRTLESFGLLWDGEVEYQSRHTARYVKSLEALAERGLTFQCSCSRRELGITGDRGYPGTCRQGPTRPGPTAIRFRVPDITVSFEDRAQGCREFDLRALGDVVIRRRDGVFAYQLAVVVDDAAQSVSDIIRGCDLLESTGWQIALQRALRFPAVSYLHLPLIVDASSEKLSKTRRSLALDPEMASTQLAMALRALQHSPPAELEHASPRALLEWACHAWDPKRLRHVTVVTDDARCV
jgi:glutamyl-Q tRNA(Asp) synthetase